VTSGRLSGILPFPGPTDLALSAISTSREDLVAWLRLTLVPDVSVGDQLALLRAYGTPERVFTAPRAQIAAKVGEGCTTRLLKGPSPKAIDAALKWLGEPNHHFVALGDAAYPKSLAQIAVPPCALYVQGRTELLNAPSFAIVGSRNASPQGARDAESFAHALSSAGLTIVSGLALGIDAAAHRGGLRAAASSVAVMGTGADRIYPRRNHALAHELATAGALISEFALGTQPAPGNFPRRNRLISGLARGVLVAEAAVKSGSLITAQYAVEQNRDVFAIPGSIHSPLSKGCHELIKEGAKLVESADDILAEIGWRTRAELTANAAPVEASHDPLLDAMGHSPVSIDQIAERTGRGAGWIAARLSLLEIEGAVAAVAGGFFQRMLKL
jgi:DNA processing protein